MGETQRGHEPISANLTTFLDPLRAVQDLLEVFGKRGVIIGGVAVSLLGKPRFTADVDAVLLLPMSELARLFQEASARGMQARIAEAEAFARRNRVLLLRHVASGIDIDISLGILPFEEEMVKRSQLVAVGDLEIRLPTPEDLIILKAVAHRPKDLLDIETLIASQPDLDYEHIRYWVKQFADALEMPEIWEDLQRLIK